MSHYSSMDEDHHQEMQLLSYTTTTPHASSSSHPPPSWPARFGPSQLDQFPVPSLDLQLSISLTPLKPPSECVVIREVRDHYSDVKIMDSVEALKWEAAEQIRLAAMEKAYAEHVMELTRREMELAQSEFLRARGLWERAREEVERAEKMRERSSATNSTCMDEITCFSCSQKFRP